MHLKTMRTVYTAACVLAVTILLLYYNLITRLHDNDQTAHMVVTAPYKHTRYLVDSPTCKIPDLDPFDPSIQRYIHRGKPLYCGYIHGLTFQRGNSVYVNRTVVNILYSNMFTYCDSDTIIRVHNKNSDSKIKFIRNNVKFNQTYTLSHEFTRIRCYNTSGRVIHYNFYVINTPKPAAKLRYQTSFSGHVLKNSVKRSYNVLLVGIDSTSRLNFIRHLVQTRRFLLNKLKAIEQTGYNKVGDNTFPNLTPLLTGKFIHELPYNITRDKAKPFDAYDFIFKRFGNAGYRTLFAEDNPSIATFNYLKKGFYKQRADDYMRPMALAMSEKSLRVKNKNCVHERAEHDIYLDYVHRFMEANKAAKRPYFGFTFLSRITHYNMNRAALADGPHVKFLRRLYKHQLLDDTIMLYFSDHGMRYGRIRNTYIGRISSLLPAMYVYLPPSFKRDYPQLYMNVRVNAHRLTTPFDIYETLRDLLYFNNSVGQSDKLNNRGIGLFNKIPITRSCTDAGIGQHWCACSKQQPLPTTDALVRRSARVLLHHLNNLTRSQSQCEILHLDQITTAYKVIPNINIIAKNGVNQDKHNKKLSVCMYYEITIVTRPGGGRFDAMVKRQLGDDRMVVSGDVSRINLYGETSWCVGDAILKKVCYCKHRH